MKDERVKLGVISNKVFLLLVVDAISSLEKEWEIKNRESVGENKINIDNVAIISETNVEAFYFVTGSRPRSMKYKVSFT